MRILLVTHRFLPAHPSGVEIHTWQVGVALGRRGHEVHVFTAEKDVGRPNLRLDRRTFDGLPVHELVNNLFHGGFRGSWDHPPVARVFGELLDELEPDVVHVMHLLNLSVGCVEEAARRGIPVLFTLHDFWLQCPRFGQRVHADSSICHEIDFDRCGECLTSFKFGQTPVERATSRLLAGLNTATGLDLAPAARRVADGVKARLRSDGGASPAPELARGLADEARLRDRELRRRLLAGVHRFIAPSRFLRERFLEWGIPAERIVHSRYGIDLAPFAGFRREPDDALRFGFIGTLAHHKGPHVLLEAWGRIPPELRRGARLEVHGPRTHDPRYLRDLDRRAAEVGVRLAGGLDRGQVVRALARIDCLVVPSLWYENSPLVILEALATGTPVLVSDLGGMAELVEPGETGHRFRVGDAADLAGLLERILADPSLLDALFDPDRPGEHQPRSVEENAAELEGEYRGAVDAVAAR